MEKIATKNYLSDSIVATFELDQEVVKHAEESIVKTASRTPTEFKLKEQRGELLPEPLLTPDQTRFVLFPIKHADVSVLEIESYSQSSKSIRSYI